MTDATKTTDSTNEAAIRRMFDAGCAVSDMAKMRLFPIDEIVAARAAWASERAAKIGKSADAE